MKAYEIEMFRERLSMDEDNLYARRSLHEQYEWLESYWQDRYKGNNHISKFSSEFQSFLWDLTELREMSREFSAYPPVGSSNKNFDPTESVVRATFFLRHHCGLFEIELPNTENGVEIGKKWNRGPLEAILTIVKQVRDNLFHGRKMDLEGDKYQRNKELVTMSSNITMLILNKLTEAEHSVSK